MRHRISAGALVEEDGRILLVRHVRPEVYDFWVAPGGGAKDEEELAAAAMREVREESGLDVAIGQLVYVEELLDPDTRHYWEDKARSFPGVGHLGLRRMTFW